MPTYVYECDNCHHRFEVMQHMTDAPLTVCPKCGKAIHRVITGGSGVIYKGTGFYCTDRGLTDYASYQKEYKETGKLPSVWKDDDSGCKSCPHAETGKCGAA